MSGTVADWDAAQSVTTEISKAARSVYAIWQSSPVIEYADVETDLTAMVAENPERYLSPIKRPYLRRNLYQDGNRMIGDRLGVPRPDRDPLPPPVPPRPDHDERSRFLQAEFPWLWLHYVDGWKVTELAVKAGKPLRTVERRIGDERTRFAETRDDMIAEWHRSHRPRQDSYSRAMPVRTRDTHDWHWGCELGPVVFGAIQLPESLRAPLLGDFEGLQDDGWCPEVGKLSVSKKS